MFNWGSLVHSKSFKVCFPDLQHMNHFGSLLKMQSPGFWCRLFESEFLTYSSSIYILRSPLSLPAYTLLTKIQEYMPSTCLEKEGKAGSPTKKELIKR